MSEGDKQNQALIISEETREKARAVIEEAFGSLPEHIKRIVDDSVEFDKQRRDMNRRMQSGARRTRGRIV
ncbi:MAG: hypothetical protein ACR2G4_08045 [Pyrinomonadaceae bacterium]